MLLDTIKDRRFDSQNQSKTQKSGREGRSFLSISLGNFIGSITVSTRTPYSVLGKIGIRKIEEMKLEDIVQDGVWSLR